MFTAFCGPQRHYFKPQKALSGRATVLYGPRTCLSQSRTSATPEARTPGEIETKKNSSKLEGDHMRKRGGYSGNLTHQIKVRVSPPVFKMLQDLSARRDITLAYIIREFIFNGLAALRT